MKLQNEVIIFSNVSQKIKQIDDFRSSCEITLIKLYYMILYDEQIFVLYDIAFKSN